MKNFNHKLIVGGFALILFGLILAITGEKMLTYTIGGLGLFLSLVGCFAPGDQERDNREDE
ncbi:hypothetical protein SDC9_168245 [bioreactor metagenome]|uniref:Uncharacterized protein n=1 Tax=bioreactor metagenome TaxID=1076179 RepID=A0A645G402_9ZZZZ